METPLLSEKLMLRSVISRMSRRVACVLAETVTSSGARSLVRDVSLRST